MSNWEKNVTGNMPYHGDRMVEVMLRDSYVASGHADGFYWGIDGSDLDILKWRVKDDQAEAPDEKEASDSMVNNSESPNSSEWKNGDECVFDNKTKREFDNPLLDDEYPNQNAIVHHTFKNKHKFDMVLIEFEDGYCAAVMQECISRPETPEQREERERMEAIKIMCDEIGKLPFGDELEAMSTLYDLGYRKAK